MRPEALQVEIRPRTAGHVIALTTRMLQLRARPLLAAWATCSIAISAVALLLLVWLQWNPLLVWLLVLTFGSMFAPPVVATIGMLVFSPKVKLRDVVSMSLRRALPYWLAFIPMRLATLVAAAGLLVPGYYVWRQAWFLGPVVLLEGTGVADSLKRASRFAIGYHGHVAAHAAHAGALLCYFSFTFASLVFVLLKTVIGANVPAIDRLLVYEHLNHAVGMIGFALAVPFVTMMWFFVYLDVRTRKEGWDLEIAFRASAEKMERRRGA